MSGISTILWDVGGVLLTNAWDRQQRDAVLSQFGLDRADFELRHAEVAEPWERDEVSVDEYLQRTVFFQTRSFSKAAFLDAMRAESAVLSDSALGIVRRLAASQEYELATVNNESRAMNEYRLKKFGLLEFFSAFFTSCYLGVRKPDRRIYQIALDVLQCDPEEAIFVDDRPENVSAAVSLGMHGIRYVGSAQLADELTRLGVALERNGADLLRA
ncbi:MAG TPA: HAD family phosphatase [Acidobacteriaceae bacterium]|jgi:putative hydrolase of the HAD superfamily|nr:HAD family phosphatase [Acidobacteriaceae bacterium]